MAWIFVMIKEAAWGDAQFCRKGCRTTQCDFLTGCVSITDPSEDTKRYQVTPTATRDSSANAFTPLPRPTTVTVSYSGKSDGAAVLSATTFIRDHVAIMPGVFVMIKEAAWGDVPFLQGRTSNYSVRLLNRMCLLVMKT
ncbi:hypothetical protein CEXT_199571 [Caerostris extrusa]|uniref:Uncharacterized protein n=1 Tax=Caerostris extrusa TaxID=172846 RepID=A0AAV4MVJ8_CAEEX|nr:hypothetical protein CEXT_199571 [Caerostris extrusa]